MMNEDNYMLHMIRKIAKEKIPNTKFTTIIIVNSIDLMDKNSQNHLEEFESNFLGKVRRKLFWNKYEKKFVHVLSFIKYIIQQKESRQISLKVRLTNTTILIV